MTIPLGYIERIPTDAADADSPVDTAESWLMQQNLFHCRQQASQCFVNWAGLRDSRDSSMVVTPTAGITTRFAQPFRSTWKYPLPTHYRVMVWARTDAAIATCHVNARVVADVGPLGSGQGTLLLNCGGANVPGTSVATKVVDAFGLASVNGVTLDRYAVTEGGVIVGVDIFMARLELELTASDTDPEAALEIVAATVWGYG